MKVFPSIFIIVAIAVIVSGKPQQLTKEKLFEECKAESGAEVSKLSNLEDPNSKCFVACVFKKVGKMVDGKILIDKVLPIYAKIYPNLDENGKNVLKQCTETANAHSDCEVAYVFIKCMKDKFPMKGAQTPPPED